jgi:hypothetical protein
MSESARNGSATLLELRRAVDLVLEARQIKKNIRLAQRGSATETIAKQTLDLLDRQLNYAEEIDDPAWVANARDLSEPLREALRVGLQTLRGVATPGPEVTRVEEPIVDARLRAGREIRRQARCTGGIADLVDLTARELIECKAVGDAASIGAAGSQLYRYSPYFVRFSLTIAVPYVEQSTQWLVELMKANGFRFIEVESGDLL